MSTPIAPRESGSHCHGWRWNWLGTNQTSSQRGPFCSCGILIIIGKKHHFQWQQLPLSLYLVSPVLPIPRGTTYEPISCVCRPVCWSFQTTHHLSLQGRGPVQPSFSLRASEQSVRLVYTTVPTDSFPNEPPIWGEQRQIWTRPDRAWQTTANSASGFRVGWGWKDQSSENHCLLSQMPSAGYSENKIWERGTWPE